MESFTRRNVTNYTPERLREFCISLWLPELKPPLTSAAGVAGGVFEGSFSTKKTLFLLMLAQLALAGEELCTERMEAVSCRAAVQGRKGCSAGTCQLGWC